MYKIGRLRKICGVGLKKVNGGCILLIDSLQIQNPITFHVQNYCLVNIQGVPLYLSTPIYLNIMYEML